MQNNDVINPTHEDDEINFSLPIKKKDLGSFISDLLGQQQSIERNIEVTFDINHAWIVNLHETIDQRVTQQNHANLVSFKAVIYFEDGLKRTLSSIEAFKSYVETKITLPIGIKTSWIYLIQFPAKKYPEKQQINFSAYTLSKNANKENLENEISKERSFLNYQIDHTERTWGDDIETIISSQVNEIIIPRKKNYVLFQLLRLCLLFAIILFTFFYAIKTGVSDSNFFIQESINNYFSIKNTSNSVYDLHKKLDALANILNSQLIHRNDFFIGMKVCGLVTVGATVAATFMAYTRKNSSSFLVISKESEKYREKMLRQEKRNTWILISAYILSFIMSALSGVFGNYIYAWLN